VAGGYPSDFIHDGLLRLDSKKISAFFRFVAYLFKIRSSFSTLLSWKCEGIFVIFPVDKWIFTWHNIGYISPFSFGASLIWHSTPRQKESDYAFNPMENVLSGENKYPLYIPLQYV
jgi:hypothetical protein